MKNFYGKLFISMFMLPEGKVKDTIRNLFYGEVLSERIVEYALVLSHINTTPSKQFKILDIGCYFSNFPIQLASMGYSVTAIDLMDYQLTHTNFKFIKGDIINYKFPKNSFDLVTCISTLEHIGLGFYANSPLDKRGDEQAIEAVWSALKKGGRLILTTPFGVKSSNSVQRVYDWPSLKKILGKFEIKETLFYKENKGKWELTTKAMASKVKSVRKTNAIIFIVCLKT